MSLKLPSRGSDQFNLRFPDGMRDRIRDAAEESGRSMNGEIIARLSSSLDGNLPDLSAEGFAALIKQMEAVVETSFHLVFDLRDTLPGLDKFMLEHGIERQEAVRRILNEWLVGSGYAEKR